MKGSYLTQAGKWGNWVIVELHIYVFLSCGLNFSFQRKLGLLISLLRVILYRFRFFLETSFYNVPAYGFTICFCSCKAT